ncbi:MAG: rsaA, partial [Akkermansiaceae bacterium]|nr:rsaA [Akkermansiaceae bacterium]
GSTAYTTTHELGYAAKSAGTVTDDANGSSLTSSRSIAIGGSITAAGGTGSMTISHGGNAAAAAQVLIWKKGALTLDGGTLRADGGCVFSGAQIAGSGTIQASVASTATTYQPGKITITGDWSCAPDDTVQLRLHEDQDGGCDTLAAGGLVNLGGARLDLSANPAPVTRQAAGSTYVLIDNTGDQPISGTFAGIAEGSVVELGPERFVASYQGGDGNDFTLTVVEKPPLAVWKNLYFPLPGTADSDDQADPDHDGVSNFWERAYGLNPLNPDTDFTAPQMNLERIPPPSDGTTPPPDGDGSGDGEVPPTDPPAETPPLAGFLTLTYRRSLTATDLTFAVKWSDDLANWSSEGIVDTLVSSEGGVEIRIARIPVAPAGGTGRYLRLQVTSPEPAAPN